MWSLFAQIVVKVEKTDVEIVILILGHIEYVFLCVVCHSSLDLFLKLSHKRGIGLNEVTCVVATLTETVAVVGDPCAALFDDASRDTDLKDLA